MRKSILMMAALTVVAFISCGKQAADRSGKAETEESAGKTAVMETTLTAVPPDTAQTPAQKPAVAKIEKKEPSVRAEKEEPKQAVAPPPTVLTIPESTVVRVKLVDSIDTDVHVTGAEFRATLVEPITVARKVVFESGAAAKGVLDKVVESGRLKTPAELVFRLTSIVGRDGKPVAISTVPIHEKKGSHTDREVGMIGGGALVGGVIGKITGKKGGTAIGAAAGAAAGTAAAAATGKKDIVHSAGTEVQFITSKPVEVTVE